MARHLRLRQFLLGVEGLALLRGLFSSEDADVEQRFEEIRAIASDPSEEYAHAADLPVLDVDSGYERWSSTYDLPGNPLISAEQPVVWRLLERAAPGTALDAACGTGRHALRLNELGHEVIGVDRSPAMLAGARGKVPAARFIEGDLRHLPLERDSVDLAVCALALEHLEDLVTPAIELARVVRPGGTVIISESHPTLKALGGAPYFEDGSGASGVVHSYRRSHGDYLDAFADAGLELRRCIEVAFGHEQATMQGAAGRLFPEAAVAAFLGLPAVLIWDLTVASEDDMSLDHVQIAAPAGCEPAARRFYGELLGLRELEKPASLRDRGGVWFSLGRHQLHIGVQDPFAAALKAHPALRVPAGELDRIAERLRGAGVELVWDESLPGERRFYTHDPWGNRIELLSRALPETPRPEP